MTQLVKDTGAAFVRANLQVARSVRDRLPTLPHFEAVAGRTPGRYRLEEGTRPNWWQLPRVPGIGILGGAEAVEFLKALGATRPFVDSTKVAVVCAGHTSTYRVADMLCPTVFQ